MIQFKAGYICDAISNVITENFNNASFFNTDNRDNIELNNTKGLLNHLSSFDVDFNFVYSINYSKIHPVLSVINNIITRGLPTKTPVILEDKFEEIGITKINEKNGTISFKESTKKLDFNEIFELMHIINPHLQIKKNEYNGSLGSHLEHDFVSNHPFFIQILQSQRKFETLNPAMTGGLSVDFTFTTPYLYWNKHNCRYENVTRVFEVDGPHHLLKEYVYYDHIRDVSTNEEDIETFRFVKEDIQKNKIKYEELINKDVYLIFEKNYNRKIKEFLTEYTLIFTPLGVSRIQKTIIELFIQKEHLLKKEKLIIGIIERDLPCGALAIKSMEDYFKNINNLLSDKDKLQLPKIELAIFNDTDWVIDSKLHCGIELKNQEYFEKTKFDFILDVSILNRSSIYKEKNYLSEDAIIIRSSHYFDVNSPRKIYCSKLLSYNELVVRESNGNYSPKKIHEQSINFFIQNIFRKKGFREGQLPIISRALQLKPVIGLLPTGGGKSLTFQLPVFLQPGTCLIVDPIKSLMADQVRVLKENWIDCCDYINSTIDVQEKRKRIINFRLGETLMFFVSPERFIMKEFRNVIQHIDKSKFALGFSYCVIDEVHCVSEWGHDFRTTYLMLGKNAQTYCATKNINSKVCLIGLTATASFDVLADIERELQVKHDDVSNAIIMIENTIRPELFFKVIPSFKEKKMEVLNNEFLNLANRLEFYNQPEILEKSINHHKSEFDSSENRDIQLKTDFKNINSDDLSTVIFCPVKGTTLDSHGEFKNKIGVRYVHSHLKSESKGYYYASDNEEEGLEIIDFFEKFTTNQINHMVCTKAFGMGIDKSDIRSTYHIVYSSSLESFVQECGRGGRDQKVALANVLLDTSSYFVFNTRKFITENFIANKFDRICVIMNFKELIFKSKREFNEFIDSTDYSYESRAGNMLTPSQAGLNFIKLSINETYLEQKYTDKETHDYFFTKSFKGFDIEKNHIESFFRDKEFDENLPSYGDQLNFQFVFSEVKTGPFNFYLNGSKKLDIEATIHKIKKVLEIIYDGHNENLKKIILKLENNYILDFELFLMEFHDLNIINYEDLSDSKRNNLMNIYYYSRETNDTGRLIYRLHSIGLLSDYTFDYNTKIYECVFEKRNSIKDYIEIIEKFLRRYLSENSAIEEIKNLKEKLKFDSIFIHNDLIQCLTYLTQFAYNEIALKRKRATEEMHEIMLKSLDYKDEFEQNIFLKEQIYFYFNAKYARPNFRINGISFSLFDDHKIFISTQKESILLLEKYLDVLKEGTEQNNYKHMIGACKKIIKSLPEFDLEKEWLLRLLKSFSMYAVNNLSYRSEANMELEYGFKIMFKIYENDFEQIQVIFDKFFKKLIDNLEPINDSITDINLIKNKLLQDLQQLGIKKLIRTHNSYNHV
jgi:ATP-dependent DNA helicase RecQ